MNRPRLTVLLLLAAVLHGCGEAPAPPAPAEEATASGAPGAPRPPNLVVILADEMGYETVGAYGGTSYRTPNLDKMAAEGVRFDHAYAQTRCTPSRVQLLTGKYNVRNYTTFGRMEPEETTFANRLREHGYATFAAGKWQLSKRSATPQEDPIRFGFGEYYLWFLSKWHTRYNSPTFEAHLPSAGVEMRKIELPPARENFGPDVLVGQIAAFMERHRDRPFLVYYPMVLMHDPYVKTPDSPGYDPTDVDGETHDLKHLPGMVAYTDKMVGRVLDELDKLGLAENTLVIFLGDNGTHDMATSQANGQTVRGGKGGTTGDDMRVPFIVRWPAKVPGGRVSDQLVDTTYVLPTLLQAAGVPVPPGMDGHSLLPLLEEGKPTGREWIYCWYNESNRDEDNVIEFVQGPRYKLYADGRFFDLIADPREKRPLDTNLLNDPGKKALIQLDDALASFKNARPESVKAKKLKPKVKSPATPETAP